MKQTSVARATLGRLPVYLEYLKSIPAGEKENISATAIAKALGLGEVQVRKDLGAVSGVGKPKIGYVRTELIEILEERLGYHDIRRAVIVGAGKLGRALLDYDGFLEYGLEITAAFDSDPSKHGVTPLGKAILDVSRFESYCAENEIKIGIITVPASKAASVMHRMASSGISAVWNFAPDRLEAPDGVVVRNENLALSLAHLNMQLRMDVKCKKDSNDAIASLK